MATKYIDGSHRNTAPYNDLSGRTWLDVKFVNNSTAKTPMMIVQNTIGWQALDLATASTTLTKRFIAYVGVPDQTLASNSYGRVQIGGYCASVTTASTTAHAGHVCVWSGGVITTSGAAVQVSGAWAAYTDATAASTTHNLMLFNQIVAPVT